jgi:hypothetical protein
MPDWVWVVGFFALYIVLTQGLLSWVFPPEQAKNAPTGLGARLPVTQTPLKSVGDLRTDKRTYRRRLAS